MKNIGKNMKHALEFIRRVNGWHGFNTRNRATVNAIKSLAQLGMIEVNEFAQFRVREDRGTAFLNQLILKTRPL